MNAFETGRELSIKVTNSAPKKGSKVLGDINNEPLSNETDSIDFDFPPLDISNSDINEVIDSVGTLCNSGDIELSQSDHDPLSQPLTKNTVDLNVSDLLKDDLHMNEILDHLEQNEDASIEPKIESNGAKHDDDERKDKNDNNQSSNDLSGVDRISNVDFKIHQRTEVQTLNPRCPTYHDSRQLMDTSKKVQVPFENYHSSNQVTIPNRMCMGFKSLTTGNTFKISENVLKVAQNKYRDIFEDDDCQSALNVDSIIDSSKTNFQDHDSKQLMNSSKKDHGPFENITAKNQISENFHFSNQVTIPDKMCMGFKSLTTGNTFKISENVLKVAQNKYRDIFEDDDCQSVLNVDSIIDSSNTNFQDKSVANSSVEDIKLNCEEFKENVSLPFSPILKPSSKVAKSNLTAKLIPKRMFSNELSHSTPKVANKNIRDQLDGPGKRKRLGMGGLKLFEVSEEDLNNAKKRFSDDSRTGATFGDQSKSSFNSTKGMTTTTTTGTFEESTFIFKPKSSSDFDQMKQSLEKVIEKARFKISICHNRLASLSLQRARLQTSDPDHRRSEIGYLLNAKLNRPKNHPSLKDIDNAVNFHFIVPMDMPGIVSVPVDNFIIIPSTENRVGLTEIELGFKSGHGIDAALLPKRWVENHFKWIVWKLGSYDRMFGAQCLTIENVMVQLKYRYDREIDRAERSALKTILEKDESPSRRMVLCVASILKVNAVLYELILTDGWYSIKTTIDPLLTLMINKKKIFTGLKLLIHSAELTNCPKGCDILEASNDVRLKIFYNSTRRAAWHLKLGFQRNDKPFPISLASIKPKGGPIGCVTAIISRVYPEKFMEINASQKVWRNKKAEEVYERNWEKFREQKMEEINEKVQKSHENSRKVSVKYDNLGGVSCEETLCEIIYNSNVPDVIKENLSKSQLSSVDDYWPKFLQNKRTQMSSDIENCLQNEGLSKHRNVTGVFTIRIVPTIVNNNCDSNCNFLLSFWNFKNQYSNIDDVFREGQQVTFYKLVTKEGNVLSSSSYTTYTINGMNHDFQGCRKFTKIVDTLKPHFKTLYDEFDTVGILVKLEIQSSHQIVWLADSFSNLLIIRVKEGYQNCLLFNGLKAGDTVAAINLICRKGVNFYGQAIANCSSIFTTSVQSNSLSHVKREFDNLAQFISQLNLQEFLDSCIVKINTVSNHLTTVED